MQINFFCVGWQLSAVRSKTPMNRLSVSGVDQSQKSDLASSNYWLLLYAILASVRL